MEIKRFIVEVEKAKECKDGAPSIGPVYRSIAAKEGFPPPLQGVESCWDIFRLAAEKFSNNPMLGHREIVHGKAGKYVWLTYKEVYHRVLRVVSSIQSLGVKKGERCGIYGVNCSEWVMSMEACNAQGLYCVPLYDSLGANAVEFIICHAEISIAFVEEKKIPEILKTLSNTRIYLKTIVSFGRVTPHEMEVVEDFGLKIYSWDDFLQLGGNGDVDLPLKKKGDICTIMYTSGTTGEPKGVVISNDSITTFIVGVLRHLDNVNQAFSEKDVYFSYLPLAHIFDRVMEELFIFYGASIGFWRGDAKLLIEDISELKPSILCAVPRVLDRIYSGLTHKMSSETYLKQTLFNVAYSYKLRNMMKGHKQLDAAPLWDKIVFNKVNQRLGGNVRLILSGAAPLAKHVETYLRVVTCANVLQGYGLTETCGGTFTAVPDELAMVGTVGTPLPIVDICLKSVPEMGYDALSPIPRGEICVRGNTLFSGYYKHDDLTKEVMVDGWFYTGDIGEWQPDGCMKIIDRKKNIFKLSQGEYVAVENLENIYSMVSAIDSIWIYGNSYESFLVAVVNPNKEALEHWGEEKHVSGDFNSLCGNFKAKEYILGELTKTAKEKKLKGFEFVKAIHIDPFPFDIERGLLTPSYKKKRPHFLRHYQGMIDSMYSNSSDSRNSTLRSLRSNKHDFIKS